MLAKSLTQSVNVTWSYTGIIPHETERIHTKDLEMIQPTVRETFTGSNETSERCQVIYVMKISLGA